MGFGIALFGYAFLLLNEMGGVLLGAPMLAYGFFLASRLEGYFLHAAVSSLFMLPRGIYLFCSLIFGLEMNPLINTVTFILHMCAWIMMTFFWLTAVMKIARENQAGKLERQARNRLVLTVVLLTLALASELLNLDGTLGDFSGAIMTANYISQYAIIIINTLFLHTCFVLITSARQYEKDKQELAKERAKALEKKHKEQQEAAKRLEKRNKR